MPSVQFWCCFGAVFLLFLDVSVPFGAIPATSAAIRAIFGAVLMISGGGSVIFAATNQSYRFSSPASRRKWEEMPPHANF